MKINDLLVKYPGLAGAVSVLIESAKSKSDSEALMRWDGLREMEISHVQPAIHRVKRIEFRGPDDVAMILDDDSELVGISRIEAECRACGHSTWKAEGYVSKLPFAGEAKP